MKHYHVVTFIDGCLNDGDLGPYMTLRDARATLGDEVAIHNAIALAPSHRYRPAGKDRYSNGLYILKIEACEEVACLGEGV